MSVRIVTVCNKCPCLNTDYEQGSWCNLKSSTAYRPYIMPDGKKEWAEVSYDCNLSSIAYDEMQSGFSVRVVLTPKKITIEDAGENEVMKILEGDMP